MMEVAMGSSSSCTFEQNFERGEKGRVTMVVVMGSIRNESRFNAKELYLVEF